MAGGFVLSSDRESFPRSIIEPIGHGLSVLTSDAGGTTGLVTDGKTGLVYSTETSEGSEPSSVC